MQLWLPKVVAEAIGAFALCFVGVLAMSNGAGLTGVALAYGLVVLVMVAALAHVSGGHFNPAVTIALLLSRRIDPVIAGIYVAAQIVGGVIAAIIVAMTVSRDAVAAGTPTLADGVNPIAGIVLEALATALVILVIYGTIVDSRAPALVYPFAIGLAVAAGVFAIGPLTGGALNLARAFGPALVGGEWGGVAAWLFGPILGALLAWLVYEKVLVPPPPSDDASPGGRRRSSRR